MTDLAPGSVFAGYRIEEAAGRGGMGVVYRATDLSLDRSVALKLIAGELAANAGFRRRFESESKTAASLDHPNVIPIFGAGEHEGALFLVMRYVDGDDLRSEIEAHGRLPPERVAKIIAQVASALDAAHAAGLVHRDVKPANILLTPSDHAYLMDFGLTKRILADEDETQTGHLLGTLNYVAPEQIRGAKVDARTDTYALGCVIFHALTGQAPFPMKEQEAKLWAHISEAPPAASTTPGVPGGVDAVIARAMAKEPSERFDSAGTLAEALAGAVDDDAATPVIDPAALAERGDRPVSDRVSAPEPVAVARPTQPPLSRRAYQRALIARAAIAPFSLAVPVAILLAGLVFDRLALVLPLALLAYAAAVWVTIRDDDFQRRILDRERAKRGYEPETDHPPRTPARANGTSAPRIAALLGQAEHKADRIRDAIERANLPYAEVSAEVERLLATMRQTAERAELLCEGLQDAPPEAISRRLRLLEAEGDPNKRDLIDALSEQLSVQRKMQVQLDRFYDRMEGMLVEFDTVRGHLIAVSATTDASDQRRVAEQLRDLREEVGEVSDGLRAAYAEQAPLGEAESG